MSQYYAPKTWRYRLVERLEDLRRPKLWAACDHDWDPEDVNAMKHCLKCGYWDDNEDWLPDD